MSGGVVTALEVQKRNKKRVNVYLDGEYAFSLPIDEAAKLHKGQQLDDSGIAALKGEDEVQRAVDSAARFLAVRPRSTYEVRQNLLQKDVPEPMIAVVMTRLEALGYLDDEAFATFWVQQRNSFKPVSQRALRYELRQKGLPDTLIAQVLDGTDFDDAALRAAESQLRRLRGSTPRQFRDKLLTFLQRRGFSYSDAKAAIRKLDETLTEQGDFFANDAEDEGDVLPEE
jgi:regulatory protein